MKWIGLKALKCHVPAEELLEATAGKGAETLLAESQPRRVFSPSTRFSGGSYVGLDMVSYWHSRGGKSQFASLGASRRNSLPRMRFRTRPLGEDSLLDVIGRFVGSLLAGILTGLVVFLLMLMAEAYQ